jgi:hypothetical protein
MIASREAQLHGGSKSIAPAVIKTLIVLIAIVHILLFSFLNERF